MTTAEYLASPETVLPQKLAYGVLRVADAPLAPHQFALGGLHVALLSHLEARRSGDVWLSPMIEVLSPNPRVGTIAGRPGWFARYDVRE